MTGRQAEKQRLRDEQRERERAAERATRRRSRLRIGLAAVAGAIVVAVAGAVAGRGGDESSAPAGTAAATITDVHGIGVNPSDKALYIATHSGLFRSPLNTATATRVAAPEQDLMGFSVAGPTASWRPDTRARASRVHGRSGCWSRVTVVGAGGRSRWRARICTCCGRPETRCTRSTASFEPVVTEVAAGGCGVPRPA